ncbi:hypothetical protein D3C87_1383610 [compost metagenome]
MKNFKLLLGAAVIFAVGSAFTANNNKVAGEYVLEGNRFVPKGEGSCIDEPTIICDYTKIGNATTPQYPQPELNPANFTPHTTNARYVE